MFSVLVDLAHVALGQLRDFQRVVYLVAVHAHRALAADSAHC